MARTAGLKAAVGILCLAAATASIVLLATGGELLEQPLPGGLPIGNLVTPVASLCVAGVAWLISPAGTIPRYLAIGALIAAVLWLPVSIALAGNLELNFSGARGEIWVAYSIATDGLALLALVWGLLRRLVVRLFRRRSRV